MGMIFMNTYRESSRTAEKQLNNIFSIPVQCVVYGSALAEVLKAKISETLPQITLVFRALGSKLEQTILYANNYKVIKFDDPEVAEAVSTWQQELEKAFRGEVEIKVIPLINEVPEEPVAEAVTEVLEETVTEDVKDNVVEEFVVEETPDVSPAEFIDWAVENLKTMTEDKATFKKDIPEQFIMWAATKRTITDGQLLTMLAEACPVDGE
jgi:DNA mismatch repair ATPase MutL